MEKEPAIIQQEKKVPVIKERKERKFLPVVISSRIARNRIEMMKKDIDTVQQMNLMKRVYQS